MKIQNKNYRQGEKLAIGGNVYTAADGGAFDIPESDAKKLLGTPGWRPVRKARPVSVKTAPPEPEEVAETEPPPPEEPQEPAEGDEEAEEAPEDTGGEEAPEEGSQEDEEEEETPSESWLKAELLDYCDRYGVEADDSMTKAQIIEAIDAAAED